MNKVFIGFVFFMLLAIVVGLLGYNHFANKNVKELDSQVETIVNNSQQLVDVANQENVSNQELIDAINEFATTIYNTSLDIQKKQNGTRRGGGGGGSPTPIPVY